MRGFGRISRSDLTLAARPDWAHSFTIRISVVLLLDLWHCRHLEGRVGAPHGMQGHIQLPRQRNLGFPGTGPLCDRLGPAAQARTTKVSAEDRVGCLVEALSGEPVSALGNPPVSADFTGFLSPWHSS